MRTRLFRRGAAGLAMVLVMMILAACGSKPTAPAPGAPSSGNQTQGAAATGPCAAKASGGKVKVGFIYISSPGDHGWTYQHDVGRKHMEQKLPWVETTIVENVPEGADAQRVMEDLIRKGYKILVTTAYGYQDYAVEVGKKYKDVVILNAAGFKTHDNVGQFYTRLEEGRYLTGIVAGKMTKTNDIGFLAAYPIPLVLKGVNAFARGVWTVNPKAKVRVVFTNSWYDPTKETQAAESLLGVGVDVLAQHQDSPSALLAAQKAGKLDIGSESDTSKFAPDSYLTGTVSDWRGYYEKNIQAICDGTWKTGVYMGGLADGSTTLGPISSKVPEDVKKLVEQAKQDIISGKLNIWTGPIKDQSGKVRVEAGKAPGADVLDSMDWLIEGIQGTIPKT